MPIDDAVALQKQAEAIRAREEAEAKAKAREAWKAKKERLEMQEKALRATKEDPPSPAAAPPTPSPPPLVPTAGPPIPPSPAAAAPNPNPSPRLPGGSSSAVRSPVTKTGATEASVGRASFASKPQPKAASPPTRRSGGATEFVQEAPGSRVSVPGPQSGKEDPKGKPSSGKAKQPVSSLRGKPTSKPDGPTGSKATVVPTKAMIQGTAEMAQQPRLNEQIISSLPCSASVSSHNSLSEDTIANFQLSHLSHEQLTALRETFFLFDKDGDGTVTVKELGMVMRGLGQNPTDEELSNMIRDVDRDGSGAIDFEEFAFLMSKQGGNKDSNLRYAFSVFDTEGSGRISAHNLRQGMEALGHHLTDVQCAEIVRIADVAKKGYVDFTAFKEMMSAKT